MMNEEPKSRVKLDWVRCKLNLTVKIHHAPYGANKFKQHKPKSIFRRLLENQNLKVALHIARFHGSEMAIIREGDSTGDV
jgi:hypothetical protein